MSHEALGGSTGIVTRRGLLAGLQQQLANTSGSVRFPGGPGCGRPGGWELHGSGRQVRPSDESLPDTARLAESMDLLPEAAGLISKPRCAGVCPGRSDRRRTSTRHDGPWAGLSQHFLPPRRDHRGVVPYSAAAVAQARDWGKNAHTLLAHLTPLTEAEPSP